MSPFPSTVMLAAVTLMPWFPVAAVMSKAYWPLKVALDAVPVILTGALWTFFVTSVTEVAMMTAEQPAGAVAGAVSDVLAPLAVEVRVNEPQAGGLGVQLHCTPALAVSFTTVAATPAVPPPPSEAGGAVVMV